MLLDKIDNPIGLDISELSIKFVQFKRAGVDLHLSAFGDIGLPPGLIDNEIIHNEQGLADFLREWFDSRAHHTGRVRGHSIVASVPESKAYVRIISLPPMLPEELETAVPLEVEQYIPLPMDQMEVGWQVVSSRGQNTQVLIQATPKDYVEKLVNVIRSAGLIPQALEMESAAIVRCLLPKDPSYPIPGTLILDMNAARTSLIVFADNSIQFTSSFPMAGNALTDAISKRLGVDKNEAEHIKRLLGIPVLTTEDKRVSADVAKLMAEITHALDPILNNLYDEVKNTIKFHEEHSDLELAGHVAIQQIILCGGTSKLPNLIEYLQGKLLGDEQFKGRNIKVSLANPWVNVVSSGPPPFSRREALSYTTSLGLALRNYL